MHFLSGYLSLEDRQKEHIKFIDVEHDTLTALLAKGSLKAKKFKRATSLLELDRGKTLQAVAAILNANYNTVAAWRDAYHTAGLAYKTSYRD